jgi:hypothetical protein
VLLCNGKVHICTHETQSPVAVIVVGIAPKLIITLQEYLLAGKGDAEQTLGLSERMLCPYSSTGAIAYGLYAHPKKELEGGSSVG